MADAKPTVLLLHGDEVFAREAFVARLLEMQGEDPNASLNVQRMSTESATLSQLVQACAAVPFLAKRRIVILHKSSRWCEDADRWDQFRAALESVPPSTALVLIEPETIHTKSGKSRLRLLAWATEHAPAAFVRAFPAPQGPGFAEWVVKRARGRGGAIEPQAAQVLAELVAEDVERADQELVKLLDYLDGERPIRVQDVELLTAFHGQPDVFAMVDALGKREAGTALARLQRLLDEEDPHYAFSMVIRQFRLLLRARESIDAGHSPVQLPGVHPLVARKVAEQARSFHLSDLERIHHRLMEIDLADKSGGTQLEATLVGLFAAVAG